MLLDFRNETAFTGWGLKSIKEFLVGTGAVKIFYRDQKKVILPIPEHNALNTNK
jgi:hypothetical protein